jgi:protein TonB
MTPAPGKSASGKTWRRHVPLIIGSVIVCAVAALLLYAIMNLLADKKDKPARQIAQVVKIIRPPPPPEEPPPPPPEEKIEEPLPQDSPEPAPTEDTAPAEALGLDADGVAGSDGFGLAARKGGRELGLGGAAFAWYTALIKDSIVDVLTTDERLRKRGSYQVTVRVWLKESGEVDRIKLASTSGNVELDATIERVLERMARVREAPPLEMPQPITLKIVSRG